MNAVLLSIRPQHCANIASGRKTVELRKRVPKLPTPYKCYIYCTKGDRLTSVNGLVQKVNQVDIDLTKDSVVCDLNGMVIGEFVCDEVTAFGYSPYNHGEYKGIDNLYERTCLNFEDIFAYIGEGFGYGLHISELKIYDKPREISEFYHCDDAVYLETGVPRYLTRPPQSWCYVEELK